jgi:hypothetical protein
LRLVGEAHHPHPDVDLRILARHFGELGKGGAHRIVKRGDPIALHRAGAIEREHHLQLPPGEGGGIEREIAGHRLSPASRRRL